MNKLYTIVSLALISLAACKSASKAYDRGNYEDAIEIAVKKLQKDPYDGDAKYVLQNAYKYAVNRYEEQIRDILSGNAENRYEAVYQQYNELQKIYNNIHESPAAVQAVKPTNYATFLRTYQDKSAEVYYEKGLALMARKDADERKNFKEAYYQFRNALRFKPNDTEITDKLKAAKDSATINVLLTPMDGNSSYMYSSNSQIKNFQTDLVRNIRYGINNEFVNFMTDFDATRKNIQPDEIIEMRFGNFSIGRPYDQAQTKEVSQEVVVKETVYKPDSIVKQYAKVYAKITTTKRTLVSNADLFINIRDKRGANILSDNVTGQHNWTTEFATFTGDERALTDADRSLLNKQGKTPPRDEDIVQEVLKQLQNNVGARLRTYYSRYN